MHWYISNTSKTAARWASNEFSRAKAGTPGPRSKGRAGQESPRLGLNIADPPHRGYYPLLTIKGYSHREKF